MTDEPFHDDPSLERLELLLRASGPAPEPSAELRARLLAIPAAERRPVAGPRAWWGRVWSSLPAWRLASGVLAVAALAFAIIAITHGGAGAAISGRQVALAAAPGYQATGDAVSVVANGTRRIRIRIDHLPPLRRNDVYELWLARDAGHRVSLGVFRPSASGELDATVSVPDLGSAWQGVWLTLEKGDGAPGWSHDWVLAGRL
jgi:anti-sigma-K factor RskA